jgi:Short-chain dehydrogenases of various substrate specificities
MKKVAVITGATKGIGKAITEVFANNQFDLAICARNKEDLDGMQNQLLKANSSLQVMTSSIDMQQRDQVIQFADEILHQFQRVDVLVNNVGRYLPGDITTEDEGVLQRLIEINLYSAYHLTRSLLPLMQSQPTAHIFNICSIASTTAYANGGAYSISKFALYGFSKNLREELKSTGVKVTSILPGATMSDSWKGSGVKEDRIMPANDIANLIWAAYDTSPQTCIEEMVLRPQLGDL